MNAPHTPDPSPNRPAWWRRLSAKDTAPLASLAAIVIFFAIFSPSFLAPSTVVHLLKQGSVLAIVAAGLTFVLLSAEIDLSVGMVALWSACFCGWLFQIGFGLTAPDAGPSPGLIAIAIFLPILSAICLGVVSGVLTVWSRLPSFIITLAMMNIANGLARYLTRSETLDVPQVLRTIGNGGIELGNLIPLPFLDFITLPYSAMLALAVLIVGHVVLVHTRFGRYVYMVGGNREAARLAGVRTGLVVATCLAISALTAGVGGLVQAGRLNSASLDQNADLLLEAVACVVLGGTSLFGGEGSMGKTAIGVLTFVTLKIGLNQVAVDDLARQLLMGTVLMVALVVNGLLAKRGD
jgi:ribose transport system permease protein